MADDDSGAADGESWPGLDETFTRQVAKVGTTPEGRALAESHTVGDPAAGKARPLGLPLSLRPGLRGQLEEFVAAYHRMIEVIVAAWEHDPRLRRVRSSRSRCTRVCDGPTLRRITRDRERYVLKSPLDANGRGVVVGVETGEAAWAEASARAIAEGWLVQEYLPSPRLRDGSDGSSAHHDLALGAVDGRLVSAFVRTGHEARLNVARSGRLHPLYL
ncbi:hypothetical protein ACIQOW_10610 [Kitasatospora sp. NPDC091335]|uniref:hypothetical protein n=1 Tax=Kitasatospora sp. NPDC091335 TaxID=3364085 RepID=UPI0037F3C4F3